MQPKSKSEPELGSGALREALEDLLNNEACSCRKYLDGKPCSRCQIAIDDARAALSLSSPIEPSREPKNARELAEKLCDCADRTLNGHARELANELREEILEVCRDWTRARLLPPASFASGDGYGMSRVFQQLEQYLETGTCECAEVVRFAVELEGKFRNPQASSEIREAAGDTLWQRCQSLVERCREKTPDKWDFAHELAEICKEYAALSLSRQGAGGK